MNKRQAKIRAYQAVQDELKSVMMVGIAGDISSKDLPKVERVLEKVCSEFSAREKRLRKTWPTK